MKTQKTPEVIRKLAADLNIEWEIVCHTSDQQGFWPTVSPEYTHQQHTIVASPKLYEEIDELDVRSIWLHVLGHLVLGESRDPVFSDDKHLSCDISSERAWPIEAVTTIWAFDVLCQRLDPTELLPSGPKQESVLPRMLGELIHEYPATLQKMPTRDARILIHTSLAKCYGICVRADHIIGLQDTFATAVQGIFNRQARYARQDCDLRSLGDFFRDFEQLDLDRREACDQLENKVEQLMEILSPSFRLTLTRDQSRCWWQTDTS